MKKNTYILAILVMLLLLTGCPGLSDWHYELPNNYAVSHVNTEQICILRRLENGVNGIIVVPFYVTEFCYNDRYVGAKQISEEERSASVKNKQIQVNYYLVDTLQQEVFGPFSNEDVYLNKLAELSVEDMGEWLMTVPTPAGAEYPTVP